MFYGLDPLYFAMMLPVFILSAFASYKVKSSFKRYSKINSVSGLTGADTAREILRRKGINNVQVVETKGFLSDHYDPVKRIVRLSPKVYHSRSLSAIGVAAHETGHALQHAEMYSPLVLRNTFVPVASFGSNSAFIIIFIGFILGFMHLVKLGIILFCAVVIFQLITLPVEFNASSRAKQILSSHGFVSAVELEGVNRVLSAAAMTYVAAAVSSIMTLIYFLMRAGLLGSDD